MTRILIVAYGNPLRSDDGLAWRVAEALQQILPPEAEVLMLHQLGPEVADSASRSECVIFVDAAAGPGKPGEVQIQELLANKSEPAASRFCHAFSPANVLSLSAQLYNAN